MPNGKVTLFCSTPQGHLLIDTTADANDNFKVDNLEFNGTVKFFVKAKNAQDNTGVKITLDPFPKPGYENLIQQGVLANTPQLLNYLKSTQKRFDELENGILNKTIMLQEVKINDKRAADKYYVKNSSKLGNGTADHVIRKEKLNKLIRLIDAFYGMAGIEVKDDMVFRVGRATSITRYNGVPMQIMVNGHPIDWNYFGKLNPADVEAIEVMTSGPNIAIYGNDGFWGVIEITMKYGPDDNAFKFTDNVSRIAINGYAVSRQFYSPMYDVPDDSHKQADLRSTIYWAPHLVTDAEGKASLNYFTADEAGTYSVVAEGLDFNGKLLRKSVNYTVK